MEKKCVCGQQMTKAEWKNQWVCYRCGRTEPLKSHLTNADHIRALSDQELAELVCEYVDCVVCPMCCLGIRGGATCEKRILEWLQQPVERDTP